MNKSVILSYDAEDINNLSDNLTRILIGDANLAFNKIREMYDDNCGIQLNSNFPNNQYNELYDELTNNINETIMSTLDKYLN